MLTIMAFAILVAVDIYALNQLHKHEIAISELLGLHPDLLYSEEDDEKIDN